MRVGSREALRHAGVTLEEQEEMPEPDEIREVAGFDEIDLDSAKAVEEVLDQFE